MKRAALFSGLFSGLLLLAACVTLPVPGKPALTEKYWALGSDWDTAMQREEADFLSAPQARARRAAGSLELQLNSGVWHLVPEDRRCASPAGDVLRDCVRKYALQRLPQMGYWLLALRLYQGEAYALVSEETGEETVLIGLPQIGPDGRHVVAVNSSGRGDTQNGIEVWQRDAAGLHLVFFHAGGEGIDFRFIDWISADLARLARRDCNAARTQCQPPREVALARRDGRWRVLP